MSDDFKVIIPAIFDAGDIANKVMLDIHGKPMIQHVFERARDSAASEVVIATDNPRVGMEAEGFGATVCMIVEEGLTGLSCMAVVVDKMGWGDDSIIVDLPGDAPLMPAELVDQVAENLISQAEADCSTLFEMVSRDVAERDDTVNLVTDNAGNVLYFSRLPLPYQHSDSFQVTEYKRCITLRACRAGLLRICRNFSESELDQAEEIEELKLMYNGMKIHAAEAGANPGRRVISKEDIETVSALISEAE